MELSTEILVMLTMMMISILGGYHLRKKKSRFLQEAGFTTLVGKLILEYVLLGMAGGLFLKIMNTEEPVLYVAIRENLLLGLIFRTTSCGFL